MAKLLAKSLVLGVKAPAEDWRAFMNRQVAALEALIVKSNSLADDELVGTVLSWPVADGKAHYLVTREKPLTVQHIDYLDGYSVDPILIRGLRRADVIEKRQGAAWLRNLFARKVT